MTQSSAREQTHIISTQNVRFESQDTPPSSQPSARENVPHKRGDYDHPSIANQIAQQIELALKTVIDTINRIQLPRSSIATSSPHNYDHGPSQETHPWPSSTLANQATMDTPEVYPNLSMNSDVRDHTLKCNKVFKQILAARATTFDGKNCLEYKPWKDSLIREVKGLKPDAAQWLDLLEIRTTGTANQLIKDLRVLHLESSPEHALKSAWETLNERYYTKQRPSQHLLQNLLQGPVITSSEPDKLFSFVRSCKMATELMQCNRGLLSSLEEQTTQDTIIRRLE